MSILVIYFAHQIFLTFGKLFQLLGTETIFMGTILIQINFLIPIIGRDHALFRINYPMLDNDFIHYNISIFWKICPNYWQVKLYSWDHNQGFFILQFQYLGETIHSWGIGVKVLRFTVLMMTQFQFLGKHLKKAQILFSLQPIKRWKLPNKFCFHLVLFLGYWISFPTIGK